MQTVKDETAKTEEELRGLQDSKTTPTETASTGQPLTREFLPGMVALTQQPC